MLCCALVVLGLSAISARSDEDAAFTRKTFATLAAFLDFKQVVLPIAGGLLLYLVVTLVAHQSQWLFVHARAQEWRELVHAEVSSILLTSSSLAFTLGALQFWSSSFLEGFKTISWWPVGLFLAYVLRPKSQERSVAA
jgi:hypothetical protein